MQYTINPLKLKSMSELNALRSLLKNSRLTGWKDKMPYNVKDMTIQLTSRIILVPPQGPNEPVQYYVVSPFVVGEGSQSKLFSVERAFYFPEDGLIAYRDVKSMLVKLQWNYLSKAKIPHFLKNMQHEYDYSKEVRHLGVRAWSNGLFTSKTPDTTLCESSLVLKKMPGIEFFTFISAFYPPSTVHFPSAMRMRLMIEILRAFQTQVYQYHLYHGDLKAENMIVDLGIGDDVIPPVFDDEHIRGAKINIIDYAGSQHFGESLENHTATLGYVSPEITQLKMDKNYIEKADGSRLYPPVLDEKSDLFSIGKIIALLWSWPHGAPFPSNNSEFCMMVEHIYSKTFLNEPDWFSVQCLFAILAVVADMTEHDRNNRLSLQQAIDLTEQIIQQYFQPNTPVFSDISVVIPAPPFTISAAQDGSDSDSEWSDVGEPNILETSMAALTLTPNTVTAPSPFLTIVPQSPLTVLVNHCSQFFWPSPVPHAEKEKGSNASLNTISEEVTLSAKHAL